ncbi:MAG TPA: hypothetical protein VMM81_04915 [Acidimicrobiia bacterium]|nr:hypothetical protein [Acidimicrobiia bacterium]
MTAKEEAADTQPRAANIDALARAIITANRDDFTNAARSHRFAFTTMKWTFLVVFLVALGAMIAAVRVAIAVPETGFEWPRAGVIVALAGASILLFAVLFYMRPLAALERNSTIQAFQTLVINSYWTRMLYLDRSEVPSFYLEEATAHATEHLGALLDRQLLGVTRYMDLVRRVQDQDGLKPDSYGSPL